MARAPLLVQRNAASVASIPAPVGGWNARDSFANMKPTDAVTLENFFPSVSNVVLRGGYTRYATGLGSQVETLMAYSSGTASKFFAIAGTKIYDVSSSGAVGAAVVTGLSNARWQYANITTAGGSFLIAVNGADDAILYDGSTWSNPSISGVTASTLDNVVLFKHRLWFHQKNTLKAWYLPTDSIGGTAQPFDLSSVATLGGKLIAIGTWTVDAGYGADDNLVFVTSKGEVIVYRGTDPASASTWSLIGVWTLGAPVGNRCMIKYGGDLLLLTLNGLFPLGQTLQSDRVDPTVALSDKIQGAIASATSIYKDTFGWQVVFSPLNNAVFVNVPFSVGAQQQYVMNTITQAWCNFTGWAANCWEIYNDTPYFGGDGYVGKAFDSGYADNATDIATNALQAFNYFGSRGVKKYFTRARPSIFTNGTPSTSLGMNVDFNTANVSAPLSFSQTAYGVWDSGLWDVAIWGSGLEITNNWQGINGLGYCGGVNLKTASQGVQIEWASTDVVYQKGWGGI